MKPSSEPLRIRGARWALAIATVALALFLRPARAVLADPASCTGLFDALAVLAIKLRPDTPALQILSQLNVVAVVAAWLAVWSLAARVAASTVAATAVTLAFATSPVFDRVAAPTPAIAVLGVAVAAHALLGGARRRSGSSPRANAFVIVALLLATLTMPSLALPAAIVVLAWPWVASHSAVDAASTLAADVGVGAWRRVAVAMLAILAGVAALAAVPELPSLPNGDSLAACLLPSAPGAASLPAVARAVILQLGPLPLAAVLLGVFRQRTLLRTRAAVALAAAALLAMSWSGGSDASAAGMLAPMLVALWCLAACGLSEMLSALGSVPAHRIAAIAMAAMVPLLQFSRARSGDPELRDQVRGHESLTATSMSRILSTIPAGGVLIVDDAIAGLVASSQAGTRRVATRVLIAPLEPAAIGDLAPSRRVFVMPRAQFALGHAGFDLRTNLQPRVAGVAELGTRTPCHDAASSWAGAPDLLNATRIAALAHGAGMQGPVVIYLGLAERSDPHPTGWPDSARRGLTGRTYDRSQSADVRDLDRRRSTDSVPAAPDVFNAPIVVRLELWRAAGGLTILPIDVGTPIVGMLTRLRPDVTTPSLTLCRAFAGEIEPLR